MSQDHALLYEALQAPELRDHLKDDNFYINNKLFLSKDDAIHLIEVLKEIQQNRSMVIEYFFFIIFLLTKMLVKKVKATWLEQRVVSDSSKKQRIYKLHE